MLVAHNQFQLFRRDVVPTGLTYHTVTTFDDVCVLLERGKRARATGQVLSVFWKGIVLCLIHCSTFDVDQHALNHNSSRSHLVLSVVITVHSELEDSDVVSRCAALFIDECPVVA